MLAVLGYPYPMKKLKDILEALNNGGKLRFTWISGKQELILHDNTVYTVDGRSYQAFIHDCASYQRTETGSTEAKDLVIEWSKV